MFFFSTGVHSSLKKMYQREREKRSLRERKEREKDVIEMCRIYFSPEGMEKIESAENSNSHRTF